MTTEKKSWYKRWWAITLFIIIGIIILSNLFGGDDSSNSGTPATTQPASIKNVEATAEKSYSIGDSIPVDDFTWKITKVSTTSEIGEDLAGTFMGQKADGLFVILDVEVENTANTAQYLTDSFIKLVDSQNREFSPNSVAAVYLQPAGSALIFEQINPGITKKGKIVYDVPANVKTFDVKITSGLFTESKYDVKIMI